MQYICDIISPMFLTVYPLSMTSKHSVLMSPHSAYVWHPLHCTWHRIHSITPNNAIYDITSTSRIASHPCIRHCTPVSLSSQPLHWYHTHFWMTSHAPSEWHPMPYMEHHIQSLCHHCTVLMTSHLLYLKAHPVCRATYTLHMSHHTLYLCPHTHCVDNITCILGTTSHSPYMWHRFHYARHHILTLWPQTTVFMSSQPLYLTACPLYLGC